MKALRQSILMLCCIVMIASAIIEWHWIPAIIGVCALYAYHVFLYDDMKELKKGGEK